MEKRIGFGRRLGAYVIDALIATGIAFIVVSLWGTAFENFVDWSEFTEETMAQMSMIYGNFTETIIFMSVVSPIITFLYFITEGFTGYTLGKLILGIQVGTQDGTAAKQTNLMIRFAIKNISTIIGLIGIVTLISFISTLSTIFSVIIIVGCFFVLGENKLALHDMIAKTAVYRKAELEDGTAAETIPVE